MVDPKYTPQQQREVRSVLGQEDLYTILGIRKNFTESEIRKAYRKVSKPLIHRASPQIPPR